jgi:uncharacterized protein YecT (DUF1311 family)
MPVYYSKKEEADPVFHVFLGCAEGSKIAIEDRVEKVRKRTVCRECLILMKQATWVLPRDQDCDHEEIDHRESDHRPSDHQELESRTGS